MTPRRRFLRFREDGALLLVLGLLLIAMCLFIGVQRWWLAGLASIFCLATGTIWVRQIRARWCPDCDAPMEMQGAKSGDRVVQVYHCEICGKRQRSGVELGWPE